MKKQLLFTALCLASLCAFAQPKGHKLSDGHHLNFPRPEQKTDYRYRLASMISTDEVEFLRFCYDWESKLIAVRDSVVGDYSVIDSLHYNELGQMVRFSGWQYLYGQYKNVYYIDYTYNEQGLIASRTNYNLFSNQFELGGVYNYYYNEQGQITQSVLTMSGVTFQRIDYIYTDGLLTQEKWYSYDGMGLTLDEKNDFVYENGRIVAQYDSISENGGLTWEVSGSILYTYDENGNIDTRHVYDHIGESERSEYFYDLPYTMNQTLNPTHPEMNRPRYYNTNNLVYSEEHYYLVDVDHVLQHYCDYVYEYTDLANGIAPMEQLHVKFAPNPAHDIVTVNGLEEVSGTAHIIDMMGRTILTTEVSASNNTIQLGNLQQGCYIMQVKAGGKIFSQKLMVK